MRFGGNAEPHPAVFTRVDLNNLWGMPLTAAPPSRRLPDPDAPLSNQQRLWPQSPIPFTINAYANHPRAKTCARLVRLKLRAARIAVWPVRPAAFSKRTR